MRRRGGAASLEHFARAYLPEHFALEPSVMHRELFEMLETAASRPEDRGSRLAIAAPRGHAKSTVVSLAYVLWCVCYSRELFIVLISDTAGQAVDLLTSVKRELEANHRLLEDFPDVVEPPGTRPGPERWKRDDIITRNGVRISSLGAEQKIRGRRNGAARPSLIILDDVENEDLVRNPEQRDRRWEWLNHALLKSGTTLTNVVAVGTLLHDDSMLARLLDPARSPAWSTRLYRAVTQWSPRADLWDRWESLYTRRDVDENGESGPPAARVFFEANEAAMLEGAGVLWPQREGYLDLMRQRLDEGTASFDCEKQNEPCDPATNLFVMDEVIFWDDPKHGSTSTPEELIASIKGQKLMYGACDPSLGKLGRDRDDTAIITLLKARQTGVMYVIDADIRRRKPDEIIEAIITMHRVRQYYAFGIEVVQYQEFLKTELTRRAAEAGKRLYVRGVRPTTDKLGRIQSLQPLIASGKLRFSRRHALLLDQLRRFPYHRHDDGPDALQMAVEVAMKPIYVVIDV